MVNAWRVGEKAEGFERAESHTGSGTCQAQHRPRPRTLCDGTFWKRAISTAVAFPGAARSIPIQVHTFLNRGV
jgi:hypothetical protein